MSTQHVGSVPLGPFYSPHFMQRGERNAFFLVTLLDEQDRKRWALVPNVRGTGFVFASREGVHAWLKLNGFLDVEPSPTHNMDQGGLLDD